MLILAELPRINNFPLFSLLCFMLFPLELYFIFCIIFSLPILLVLFSRGGLLFSVLFYQNMGFLLLFLKALFSFIFFFYIALLVHLCKQSAHFLTNE